MQVNYTVDDGGTIFSDRIHHEVLVSSKNNAFKIIDNTPSGEVSVTHG